MTGHHCLCVASLYALEDAGGYGGSVSFICAVQFEYTLKNMLLYARTPYGLFHRPTRTPDYVHCSTRRGAQKTVLPGR